MLGLGIAALSLVKLAEAIDASGHGQIVRTHCRAFVERLRLGVAALIAVKFCQVENRFGNFLVIGTERLLLDRECTLEQGLSFELFD